jgi:hypothetical protein
MHPYSLTKLVRLDMVVPEFARVYGGMEVWRYGGIRGAVMYSPARYQYAR